MTASHGFLLMRKVTLLILLPFLVIFVTDGIAGRIGTLAQLFYSARPIRAVVVNIRGYMTDVIEPVQVQLPTGSAKNALRDQVVATIEEVTQDRVTYSAATAAASRFQLNVEPTANGKPVHDARIRIMNIRPAYEKGMTLQPGSYEVAVDADGFRSRRVWFEADESVSGSRLDFEVRLDNLGAKNCEKRLESYTTLPDPRDDVVGNYEAFIAATHAHEIINAAVIEDRLLFTNVNIHDLYSSYAQHTQNSNIIHVIDTLHVEGYVQFLTIQPKNVSKEEIDANKVLELPDDGFVLTKVMFERRGDDVLVVLQSLLPPGSLLRSDSDTEHLCDEVFAF